MTIDEAIKILSSDNFGTRWPTPKSEVKAVKLGIEALKRLQRIRDKQDFDITGLLPGETEE